MPHADGDVAELAIPRLPDLRVPHGAEIEIQFTKGERFEGPNLTATVIVSDGGARVQTRRVSVRLDVFTTAYGVSASARRGHTFEPAELVALRLPASQVPPDAIRSPEEVSRAKLRRAVRPGEPLRRAWLQVPPLVKRGDRVRMVARRGTVELSATGVALGSC